jgi:hypothetical protein
MITKHVGADASTLTIRCLYEPPRFVEGCEKVVDQLEREVLGLVVHRVEISRISRTCR